MHAGSEIRPGLSSRFAASLEHLSCHLRLRLSIEMINNRDSPIVIHLSARPPDICGPNLSDQGLGRAHC